MKFCKYVFSFVGSMYKSCKYANTQIRKYCIIRSYNDIIILKKHKLLHYMTFKILVNANLKNYNYKTKYLVIILKKK